MVQPPVDVQAGHLHAAQSTDRRWAADGLADGCLADFFLDFCAVVAGATFLNAVIDYQSTRTGTSAGADFWEDLPVTIHCEEGFSSDLLAKSDIV